MATHGGGRVNEGDWLHELGRLAGTVIAVLVVSAFLILGVKFFWWAITF